MINDMSVVFWQGRADKCMMSRMFSVSVDGVKEVNAIMSC